MACAYAGVVCGARGRCATREGKGGKVVVDAVVVTRGKQ